MTMIRLKEQTHLILLGLAVLVLGASALLYSYARDVVPGIPERMPVQDAPSVPAPETDDPLACAEAGGIWNPCASACPDAEPGTVCIQVCVERCEGLGDTATIPVYFSNPMFSSRENSECDEVYPIRRTLTRRKAGPENWAPEALKSLLEGLDEDEEAEGFSTNIPDGVRLADYRSEDGTVYVGLTGELNQAAGSCRVIAIRTQIEQTLMQFPEIDSVIIFVEGKTPEETLQP